MFHGQVVFSGRSPDGHSLNQSASRRLPSCLEPCFCPRPGEGWLQVRGCDVPRRGKTRRTDGRGPLRDHSPSGFAVFSLAQRLVVESPTEDNMNHHLAIYAIAAFTILGILLRPSGWSEAVWACLGAGMLIALPLISFQQRSVPLQKAPTFTCFSPE